MTATMDLPINREASWRQTVGIVCPHCCKQTADFILFGPARDNYGRILRSYIGRCADCGISFEVEQYSVGDLWPMYAYRIDRQPRTVLQELPEPLLATGPGGEYVRAMTDAEVDSRMDVIISKCAAILNMVTDVLKQARAAKNQNACKRP